jgi:hypothetical protein
MQKFFLSATLKLAGHHSCPCWESVIGPQTCCPSDLSGNEERVNYQMQNRTQANFERILGCFNPLKTPESGDLLWMHNLISWLGRVLVNLRKR